MAGAWQAHALSLTSTAEQKGKVSALHCDLDPASEGGLRLVAVERHFSVRRLVAYRVPSRSGASPFRVRPGSHLWPGHEDL